MGAQDSGHTARVCPDTWQAGGCVCRLRGRSPVIFGNRLGFLPALEELILRGSVWCAPQISHHCVFLWPFTFLSDSQSVPSFLPAESLDLGAGRGCWPRGSAQAASRARLLKTKFVLVLERPAGGRASCCSSEGGPPRPHKQASHPALPSLRLPSCPFSAPACACTRTARS